MTRPTGGNGGGIPPELFAQVLTPKQYQSISELLGVLANILIYGERSQDEDFRIRYIKLFDVVFKGLSVFMDKEFITSNGINPYTIFDINKRDVDNSVRIKDPGEKPGDINEFDENPEPNK